MKRLQKFVVLVLLLSANLSLWAQNDNAVIPVKIELNQCKLIDIKGTDYPISVLSPEKVTVIMKLSYYTVLPEMSFSWYIELYNSTGSLILKDGFMGPRDLIVEDDSFYLIAGQHNYSLIADLNNPRYFHVFKLGDEEAEKDFLIESDNTSWFDYYINWAYYTSMYRSAYFVRKYKENNTDEEAKDEALKYAKIADDLIEHYPNGFSAQRNKELPTLKQLQKRMKTNIEISSFFDPVTPDESNTGNATTSSNNKPTQNKSTSNNPTANTVATNLSKGEWRTSMRKVVDNVTEKYSDDVYKGQKSNGKRNGMGVYRWNSGSYYFGEWSNGNMNGYGIRVCGEGRSISNCPDCVYFVGNWKDDKKSGKGTCYDKYGNLIYYGDFADDRPTGTYPTTESYSSYKFECINYESNNSVYIGETKDGKRHGYGVYIWNNWYGNAWYGHWENDKRSGNGIDLFYDGSIKYGRWDGDEYYKPSSNPTNNNSTSNTTTNTATSKPNTTTATTDKKYTRWPYYYSNPVFGLHFGYVQRAMNIKGYDDRLNVFGEEGGMHGFQAGLFFHLFKKSMVGLAFGVNYEMYFASGSSSQNYYRKYEEINLNAPLDLTFHIPFSSKSAVYLHGGLGFDYSLYNKYTYPFEKNVYGRNALDRFNLSYEYGLDLKIKGIMLHANYQKGLTTHYPFGFNLPTTLNKFSVGISFVF